MSQSNLRSLWVCNTMPSGSIAEDNLVLSFAAPQIDRQLEKKYGDRYLNGSKVSQSVRDDARILYIRLIADLGTAIIRKNKSFKDLMKFNTNETSHWWYNMVSFKDNESEPTFDRIIVILTILTVIKEYKLKNLYFYGCDKEIIEIFKDKYNTRFFSLQEKKSFTSIIIKGFLSRFRQLFLALKIVRAVKKELRYSDYPDISLALFGFWDWSIKYDDSESLLKDRYYKALPDELEKYGIKDYCWFLWCDPYREPGSKGRRIASVLNPLKGQKKILVLQLFLSPIKILRFFLNFKAFFLYILIAKKKIFRNIFIRQGINFFPLFKNELLFRFLNADIPYHRMIAYAIKKAAEKYTPKVFINFMEFFPVAKATYDGINRADQRIISCCIQHGTRSFESTFFMFHPDLEFNENKKEYIPRPDYCFAMGRLGQRLFLSSGFTGNQAFLTGSPRFDHIRVKSFSEKKNNFNKEIILLFVASGLFETEVQALEAAILAIEDLPFVNLILREHSFYRLQDYPPAKELIGNVKISVKTLDQDLERADIVLFTSTTVAEEAYLSGKVVWQWMTPKSNSQAFRDVNVIKRFYSIEELKKGLIDFKKSPAKYTPSQKNIRLVENECFYKCDGKSAARIARVIKNKLLK